MTMQDIEEFNKQFAINFNSTDSSEFDFERWWNNLPDDALVIVPKQAVETKNIEDLFGSWVESNGEEVITEAIEALRKMMQYLCVEDCVELRGRHCKHCGYMKWYETVRYALVHMYPLTWTEADRYWFRELFPNKY